MARRLLTFNWHETYLHTLASIGGTWDVVPRSKGGRCDWWHEVRPLPDNMRLVDETVALGELDARTYSAVVCHNLLDLGLVLDSGTPTVTIFHTSKALELAHGLDSAAFERFGRPMLEKTAVVFVSPMKQDSWQLPGQVILPGVDIDAYGGWTGELQRVLHVGNLKRELASVNGMADLEAAAAGLPLTLLGLNPTIPGSRLSDGWDDLRATLRSHRVYLHTARPPYEDGYNLAMLEAMATGLPVVARSHPTSPLSSGQDGRLADDVVGLRLALLELLEDSDEAARLGAAGRDTVARRFPVAAFRRAWRELLQRLGVDFTAQDLLQLESS